MGVTVKQNEQSGKWEVLDDGLVYTRCESRAGADLEADKLRAENRIGNQIAETIEDLWIVLHIEHKLSPEEAKRRIKQHVEDF
jgi:hypothetical protein